MIAYPKKIIQLTGLCSVGFNNAKSHPEIEEKILPMGYDDVRLDQLLALNALADETYHDFETKLKPIATTAPITLDEQSLSFGCFGTVATTPHQNMGPQAWCRTCPFFKNVNLGNSKVIILSVIAGLIVFGITTIVVAFNNGDIIKLLGGFTRKELDTLMIPVACSTVIDVPIGYKTRDTNNNEHEELRKQLTLDYPAAVSITACAHGKTTGPGKHKSKRNGLVEIRLVIDGIEQSFNRSFLNGDYNKRGTGFITASTTSFIKLDKGKHLIVAEGIYYGRVASSKTRMTIRIDWTTPTPVSRLVNKR